MKLNRKFWDEMATKLYTLAFVDVLVGINEKDSDYIQMFRFCIERRDRYD